MLIKLTVSNYALITSLEVEFHSGLNSVTGETGAGKSIILGALGLILGNRADMSALKNHEEKCIVEGVFDVERYNLSSFFDKNDLDYDKLTIIRREITPSGKSRAFINDTPVNLKVLRELSLRLIDIHSQHQSLELGSRKFQLTIVDTVANSAELLREYRSSYEKFMKLQKYFQEITAKSEKEKTDLDYWEFQFNQLEEAALIENEQAELEAELEQLTHAEEIKEAFIQVVNLLDDERFSVIQQIRDSQRRMESISGFINEASQLSDRLESSMLELRDILDETERLAEKTEHNPARIEDINTRLNLIYSLQQKHHAGTVSELIELKNMFASKIEKVTGYDDEIKQIKAELEKLQTELERKSALLTALRKKAFPKIEKAVLDDLHQLGMPKARLNVVHEELTGYTPSGRDEVSLLFSANVDTEPDEISKIASGGEMSRLMLAIKNLLRTSGNLPTVIFDEIDSGVSGEIALKMGNIMKTFSESAQIINITHLPQVAARGDAHYVVYKYEEDGKTFTSVKLLNENERVEELAKMVGGDNITETTLMTAKELLEG